MLLFTFTTLRDHRSTMPFTAKGGNEYQAYGMFAAVSHDEGKTWSVRELIAIAKRFVGDFRGIGGQRRVLLDPAQAEVRAYTDAMQSPDRIIHLISSR